MDLPDLVLAAIPPLLAMLIERFNPISSNTIRLNAERDLDDFRSLAEFPMLVDTVAAFTAAVVEVSGLAPTLVSAIVSGFAVVHAVDRPFWLIVTYCLVLIVVVIPVLRLLTGVGYLDLETLPAGDPPFRFQSGTAALSATIYMINAVLIAVGVISFALSRQAA